MCSIETTWSSLHERLQKDFLAFLSNDHGNSIPYLTLKVFQEKIDEEACREFKLKFKRKDRLTYDHGRVRLNNYADQVWSLFDYENERGEVFSLNIERAHEISYLMILSRVGKKMELSGLHKIHAMSLVENQRCLLVSAASGVGKSTQLLNLLQKNPNYQMLSDDCPVINQAGQVLAFPLRVGVSPLMLERLTHKQQSARYSLERREYGEKILLPVNHLNYDKTWSAYEQIVLVFLEGQCSSKPSIRKLNRCQVMIRLVVPFFIGVGLPIIFEYFWEPGWRVWIERVKIGLSRMKSGFLLAKRAQAYRIESSKDLDQLTEALGTSFKA